MDNNERWHKAYKKRPLKLECEREVEIAIVGDRCIFINDHRVQGGKPYHSEKLPWTVKKTKVRDVLDAFTVSEINAYLEEKIAVDAYCAGARNFRDADKEKFT